MDRPDAAFQHFAHEVAAGLALELRDDGVVHFSWFKPMNGPAYPVVSKTGAVKGFPKAGD
ncbi:hypothetical protein Pelsub_P2702 [Pelolinea submarina]|nr:hypothetical protein Pelsub_P2702 [Pelolinea submarina]